MFLQINIRKQKDRPFRSCVENAIVSLNGGPLRNFVRHRYVSHYLLPILSGTTGEVVVSKMNPYTFGVSTVRYELRIDRAEKYVLACCLTRVM